MRVRLGAALGSAVAVSIGLITLAGLLLEKDRLEFSEDTVAILIDVTRIFLEVATIVIALMVLFGVLNLLLVHLRRTVSRKQGALYSIFVLIGFGAAVAARFAENEDLDAALLESAVVSVESALAGLLFFALVYGAYRMMNKRVTWSNTLFVLSLLLVLIGSLPLSDMEPMRDLRDVLLEVPVSAGARGLLLGIALGTLVTGVRVLIGVDRSYRE